MALATTTIEGLTTATASAAMGGRRLPNAWATAERGVSRTLGVGMPTKAVLGRHLSESVALPWAGARHSTEALAIPTHH